MEQWINRLIYEIADLEIKIISLKAYLKNNSASVVSDGDNMYSVMGEQLVAMEIYLARLDERLSLVKLRQGII